MTISRLRPEDLPLPGQTLPRSTLKVIAVVVGKSWKREDVRREYDKLAAKRVAPSSLLTDGAVELHETAFGGFKRLERQHSNGGFTSLIAALPIVTEELTPERVRACLSLVSVKHLKEWVATNLGETVTAKRQLAIFVRGRAKRSINYFHQASSALRSTLAKTGG